MINKILIRFDSGGKFGFGHAIRCLKVIKLFKKKDIIICCNNKTKKYFRIDKYKTLFKKNNESEEDYFGRIVRKSYRSKIIIDTIYKYKKKNLEKIEKNKNELYFFDNYHTNFSANSKVILLNNLTEKKTLFRIKKKTKYLFFGKSLILPGKNYKIRKNNKIIINFGGSDPRNISLKLLKKLNKEKIKHNIILLVGRAYRYFQNLKKINKQKNIEIKYFSRKLFFSSKLAFTSFGLSSFELINNKVFAFNLSHSENHSTKAKFFQMKFKYSKNLGTFKKINKICFSEIIDNFKNKKINYPKTLFHNKFELNALKKIKKIIEN